MKTLKKFFFLVILGGMLFGAGFILGRQQPETVHQFVQQGKEEVSEKASGLDREVRWLRQRMHQYSISRRLASAQAALADRNYGIVENELKKAKKEIASLKEMSPPSKAKTLDPFESRLEDLIVSVRAGEPILKDRLIELDSHFEQTYED
jgi:hypothetical protein